MAVKQLPTLSPIPEPPNRLVGDQERFDTMTFNSLKAQEKMVNVDLNQNVIPALNQFAVDVNASVDAAKASEASALASKNSAASSAGTATTKAGEAAASAKAAKTSETSALASKNAASSSATAAANAQKAAEAARDEAQDLANVGYAAESHAGLAKVDGKTTRADAGGVISAKDVAIGGDLGDLASARGIFDTLTKGSVDCNTLTDQGVYAISLAETVNGPGFSAKLIVFNGKNSKFTNQMALAAGAGAGTSGAVRVAYRAKNSEDIWSPWSEGILSGNIGDGLTVNNGIISVPKYKGATVSTAGTSGLVPPAAAGQQESFLTGGGEYKPALSTSGGIVTGELRIAAPAGSAEGGEIILVNGTDGKYPARIDTMRNLIRFFGDPGNVACVDLETGRFIGNLTGRADTAGTATGLAYTFTTNSSLVLPPGGTWFVLSWWDGDSGTARGNWSGGQIVAGGSSISVRNGAFAQRVT